MTSADLVAKFDNLKLATNLETRLTEATKKAVDSLKDLTNKLRRYRFRSPQVASTLDDIADATATLENPSAVEAMNSGVGPEVSQIGNSL